MLHDLRQRGHCLGRIQSIEIGNGDNYLLIEVDGGTPLAGSCTLPGGYCLVDRTSTHFDNWYNVFLLMLATQQTADDNVANSLIKPPT